MTSLRLERLTKVFPSGVVAVDRLDLDVAAGEFVALVGPSGCGKTTALRMIAGLETPTEGAVWFGNRAMNGVPAQLRNVGMVFQHHAVFPTMTVFDNVAYGLQVRRMRGEALRRRVMAYLELVGLADLAHRMPGQLSGGQQQRVALARALAIEPTLLLLDEPLSNLDAKMRLDIRKEIRRLQRQLGITAIYVTHDQEEALSVSDRVGVMHRGRLEQIAPGAVLYTRPANRFVASFVGDGTLLEGQLLDRSPSGCLVQIGPHRIEARQWGCPESRLRRGPVWVCIRPEAVVPVDTARQKDPLPAGAVQGVVEHVEFLGPVYRGDISVPGISQPIAFSWPARAAHGVAPGSPVAFCLDGDAIAIGVDRDDP